MIHGGAGTITRENLPPEEEKERREVLLQALREGYSILEKGGNSIDAVRKAIVIMEDSPLFNAGRGSALNEDGFVEMDASIMYGPTREAGAVAAVRSVKNPIELAYIVMRKTKHVLLVGTYADSFAKAQGLPLMPPDYFIVEREKQKLKRDGETVGAVAIDIYGNISAGTSTGGLRGKLKGRVGDSPIIGAGTYANNTIGVSTTGIGEYFIRVCAAAKVTFLVTEMKLPLQEAVKKVLDEIKELGGSGGIIAIDSSGNYVAMFNSAGMYRGVKGGKEDVEKVMIFSNEF